jgi:hypothetical protein
MARTKEMGLLTLCLIDCIQHFTLRTWATGARSICCYSSSRMEGCQRRRKCRETRSPHEARGSYHRSRHVHNLQRKNLALQHTNKQRDAGGRPVPWVWEQGHKRWDPNLASFKTSHVSFFGFFLSFQHQYL